MDWKEEFKDRFTPKVLNGDWMGTPYNIPKWIETEVIEKLIEDIPDYKNASGVYLREKEQLKAKWLGKEQNA